MKWILCMFGKHDVARYRTVGLDKKWPQTFVYRCRRCEKVLDVKYGDWL